MPGSPLRRGCESAVKKHLKHCHKRCDKSKNGNRIYGEILNGLIGSPVLEEDAQYSVCAYIAAKMKGKRRRRRETNFATPRPNTRTNPSPFNIDSVVRVSARYSSGGGGDGGESEEGADEMEDERCDVVYDTSHRTAYKEDFRESVLEIAGKYRKAYRNLSPNERRRRINTLSKEILAACVHGATLAQDGDTYLDKNKDLAVDVVNILDSIRFRVQKEIKLNLNHIKFGSVLTPPDLVDEESVEESVGGLDFECVTKASMYQSAVSMLSNSTKTGYADMRANFLKEGNMDEDDLPSYYLLTKNRPNVTPFGLTPSNTYCNDLPVDEFESVLELEAEMQRQQLEEVNNIEGAVDVLPAAKIDGTYSDYFDHMSKKFERKGHAMSGNIIVLDSYDGAEHSTTPGKRCNVVSYSSQVFNGSTVAAGFSTGQSLNILTWQQVQGEEKAPNVFAAVEDIFEQKQILMAENPNVTCYDMHDGKMQYLLCQHALFNCKNHPFLLCKCRRGEGVVNRNHVCVLVTHDEQVAAYNKSRSKWERKQAQLLSGDNNREYTVKAHMQWVDRENWGISHFGIHPDKLRRDNIRFDIFHLRSSITRRLMTTLRKFLMMQSQEVMDEFTAVLNMFWTPYQIEVWNLNKAFTSFKGEEILAFIRNIPEVIQFMKSTFTACDYLDTFCKSLSIWAELSRFIHIVQIPDEQSYLTELDQFEKNVVDFYECGRTTFLTNNADGDIEFFYSHVVRFYLPRFARDIFDKHKVGLGVFTMQGYERRNKESKNTMKRFTNKKGNLVFQNLKRLWDIFFHSKNAY
jgi:hypothetical protein